MTLVALGAGLEQVARAARACDSSEIGLSGIRRVRGAAAGRDARQRTGEFAVDGEELEATGVALDPTVDGEHLGNLLRRKLPSWRFFRRFFARGGFGGGCDGS